MSNLLISRLKKNNSKLSTLGSVTGKEETKVVTSLPTTRGGQAKIVLENVPDKITASFTHDFNIIQTHNTVIQMLSHEKAKVVPEIKKLIEDERAKIRQNQTQIERTTSLKNITKLEAKLDYIDSGRKLAEYESKAQTYLKDYSKIGTIKRVISLSSNTVKEETVNKEEESKRLKIIADYLVLAGNYVIVDVIRETKYSMYCDHCNEDLSKNEPNENGALQCKCGYEKQLPNSITLETKGDKESKGLKSDYDDYDNFYKCYLRFQGKEHNKLPVNLEQELDEWLKSNKQPCCAEIRKLELDDHGRRGKYNVPLLVNILGAIGHPELYENVWLVGKIHFGWQLHDLSYLDTVIKKDYQDIQKGYELITKDKTSSMGLHYRLFKHLEFRGVPCKYHTDFKTAKMRDSLEANEDLWRRSIEANKDTNLYFIATI